MHKVGLYIPVQTQQYDDVNEIYKATLTKIGRKTQIT
jgi:hypothetical protein